MAKTDDLIFGVATGDAMGFPVQFFKREQAKTANVTKMLGHWTGNYPAGTWSDDTSLTVALADSLCETEGIDYDDIMRRFLLWLEGGSYTPKGKTFDIGQTCFNAIERFKKGVPPLDCGSQKERECGNGSLMRISPLVFYIQKKFGERAFENPQVFELIHNVSRLTHAHPIALLGCDIFVAMLFSLLNGTEKEKALLFAYEKALSFVEQNPEYKDAFSKYDRLLAPDFCSLLEEKIASSGYVVDTLEAAVWCFLTTDSYRECILKVVNLGGDTDTIGAVAGAMAGIYYADSSEKGIPEEWKEALQNKELLMSVVKKLAEL
ncbi:MAG: ADP-ribosylglycohydrolase family protein [Treponema sp.]|uniref:ADP-ribosylglycohydrolase family protein n=1 Tax=Treponema sp. TaxID=166 RepID=UPI002A9195D5|nr:ADP-ribosylglycohydrolase family protein [Treponema sp.]MDY6397121.1 ADP-ribosylglycohydrolase family protein [Treponema sp.]